MSAGKATATALLLIETQNEFMHPGGAFHGGIRAVAQSNGCFANLVELARRCRGSIPLVYAPIYFNPGHDELAGRCGILSGVREAGALVRGGFGARFFDALQPEPSDLILQDRHGINAFHQSGLHELLQQNGIRRLAVCGFLTNVCVETSVRAAYDYGYEITVIRDATACNSIEEQQFCEDRILPYFAQVAGTEEFLSRIREQ